MNEQLTDGADDGVAQSRTGASRRLSDPGPLRALAHPIRLRLLELLALSGPATATELSADIGESAANCSWHLRQLAQHGFVEEAGGGRGRQRPWRLIPTQISWGSSDERGELATTSDEASMVLHGREIAAFLEWRTRRRAEPDEWVDASFSHQSWTWLTPEELAEVGELFSTLTARHNERIADPAMRPPEARPVRLMAWGFPTDATRSV